MYNKGKDTKLGFVHMFLSSVKHRNGSQHELTLTLSPLTQYRASPCPKHSCLLFASLYFFALSLLLKIDFFSHTIYPDEFPLPLPLPVPPLPLLISGSPTSCLLLENKQASEGITIK